MPGLFLLIFADDDINLRNGEQIGAKLISNYIDNHIFFLGVCGFIFHYTFKRGVSIFKGVIQLHQFETLELIDY